MTLLAELDRAAAEVANAPKPSRITWFDRLPDEAQRELLAAREKYRVGGWRELSREAFARLLIKTATDRGWPVCQLTRMKSWLDNET